MISIKYEGYIDTVNFNESPIKLLSSKEFFNHSYNITSSLKMGGFGELLKNITMPANQKKFSILIKGKNKDEIVRNINKVLSFDINNKKPGKLWVNDSYVTCFINQLEKVNANEYKHHEEIVLNVYILEPLWITEKKFEFSIHKNISNKKGFKFPMKFPMKFVSNDIKSVIKNDVSSNPLAEITFFGPAVNPKIVIDNVSYSISGELLQNERFIINQRDKTVLKITSSGDIINAFNMRQKVPSVFNPIPQGTNIIGYDRSFSLRIILFEGSVEPNGINTF